MFETDKERAREILSVNQRFVIVFDVRTPAKFSQNNFDFCGNEIENHRFLKQMT